MEKHTRLVVRVLKCFIDLKHPSLKEVAERYNSLNTLSFMSRLYRRVVWRKVTEEEILWALQDLIEEGLIKIGDDPMRIRLRRFMYLRNVVLSALGK
jgi:hypothetical protein